MPIATYIQEAWQLLITAKHYSREFNSIGFYADKYTLFAEHIRALQQAQTNLNFKSRTQSEAEQQWSRELTQAFALRETMLEKLKFIVWKDIQSDHHALKQLKKNKSIACLISDLEYLGSIWHTFSEPFAVLQIESMLGSEAQQFGETLAQNQKAAELARTDTTCRDARDHAFFTLQSMVHSVRGRAKLLFKKGSPEYNAFTSAFYRKRNARARQSY